MSHSSFGRFFFCHSLTCHLRLDRCLCAPSTVGPSLARSSLPSRTVGPPSGETRMVAKFLCGRNGCHYLASVTLKAGRRAPTFRCPRCRMTRSITHAYCHACGRRGDACRCYEVSTPPAVPPASSAVGGPAAVSSLFFWFPFLRSLCLWAPLSPPCYRHRLFGYGYSGLCSFYFGGTLSSCFLARHFPSGTGFHLEALLP